MCMYKYYSVCTSCIYYSGIFIYDSERANVRAVFLALFVSWSTKGRQEIDNR